MRKLLIILFVFILSIVIYSQDADSQEGTLNEETQTAPQVEKTSEPAPGQAVNTNTAHPAVSPAAPQKVTVIAPKPVAVPQVQPAKPPVKQPAVQPAAQQVQATGVIDETKLLAQLDANPKNMDLYNRLLNYYTAEGKHKEKLKIALKAIQNIGGNANLYIIVGDENKNLGDFSKALISYQFALKILPTDAGIYNRIGLVHLKLGNFNQAETAFRASLFFGSNEGAMAKGVYNNNLAVSYEAMHDLKSAYKFFQLAVKYYPGYATAVENFNRVKENLKTAGIEVN